ncbi:MULTISPECIES: 1-(5-phosphoribosyl)-5-[(5-phosphoribosylamino)methylideneamino]imidazole-4-carboxamide isomerase [Calditerrivibrio]|jgi:phosphoribosylformimino-5-aminoimidazole carboxamide ribotide isomerase|uniref:1-(5-phosphoribosyl)-5-[(5-phosphoribosylamino)methylideneamino] imidazole-4-carboxamide isomerase n=1 Tax=Calditerrivibrio nitroreducens TaxID=477976 RepID=A0A2J6WRK0_9BACT|nr:MAG: 1-(5-phosphoribosyl)-5-[(5-phosphoribosylamino)methylideneamino]imidazole-4-carboxamide isomerase [Calditerrivibrio nitroreducens]
MLLIPAIDLLGGRVVRLEKGDMDRFKVYSENPLDVAKQFEDMGVKRVHIVDLDGAKKGDAVNYNVIENIVKHTNLSVDVGGGIRNIKRFEDYINLGVHYVVLGTAVVKDVNFTKEVLQKYPERVILGLDAKDGYIATDGWYEKSSLTAIDVIDSYKEYDVAAIIYTDISRDGMLAGINVKATVDLSNRSPFPVIASGGLKGEEDIWELKRYNIFGCIIGKAFYEGKIDLKTILKKIDL